MKKHNYAVNDESRFIKAKKIIACLEYIDGSLTTKEVLEIGCGSGIIASEISKIVKRVTAIDITDKTIKSAMQSQNISGSSFQYITGDATKMPFADNSFDIIVSNQVFEHVTKQGKLINDMHRVLRPSGICYIATGNKWWPIEPHTKLLFLSYLPRIIANKYVSIAKLDEYDISLPSYWRWKRILSNRFDKVIDLTALVTKNPSKFNVTNEIPKILRIILPKIPLCFLKLLLPLYPSWIVVTVKGK